MAIQVLPRRPAWGNARAGLQRLVTAPAALRALPREVLIGLEHEFRVFCGDEQVDFAGLIHTLPIDGLALDPGDRDAYRCRSGIVIAADAGDAEIAIPPLAARHGFTRALRTNADAARRELEALLPTGLCLAGATTHLSISVPDHDVDRVASLYARHFVAALMLLAETPESYGVMIRPRNGRLELCTGFVDGDRLETYAAFALGSTLATVAAARGSRRRLPREVAAEVEPAAHRSGHQIRRTAFGVDLYTAGRQASLPLRGGGSISAQRQLEAAWAAARRELGGVAERSELESVEASVNGGRDTALDRSPALLAKSPASNAFGEMLRPLARPGFGLEPIVARWEAAVFRVAAADHEAYAAVPGHELERFIAGIEAGRHDASIQRFLRRPRGNSRLECYCQLATPALFASIGELRQLVRPEYAPAAESRTLAGDAGAQASAAVVLGAAALTASSRHARAFPSPEGNGHSSNGKTRMSALATADHPHTPGVSLDDAGRFSFRTIATIVAGILVVGGGVGGALALVSGGGDSGDAPAASQSPDEPSSPASSGAATSPTSGGATAGATGTTGGAVAPTSGPAGTLTQPAGSTPAATAAGGSSSPATTATALASAAPTLPPTATQTPLPTATPVPLNAVPAVSQLHVTLAAPVSTYSIAASDPEGGALTYTWQMTGEACGTPPAPWTQSGASVTWSHSSAPPDNCAHQGTNHAVTVTVTVSDSAGPGTRCTISGSDPQVINAPACQPLR